MDSPCSQKIMEKLSCAWCQRSGTEVTWGGVCLTQQGAGYPPTSMLLLLLLQTHSCDTIQSQEDVCRPLAMAAAVVSAAFGAANSILQAFNDKKLRRHLRTSQLPVLGEWADEDHAGNSSSNDDGKAGPAQKWQRQDGSMAVRRHALPADDTRAYELDMDVLLSRVYRSGTLADRTSVLPHPAVPSCGEDQSGPCQLVQSFIGTKLCHVSTAASCLHAIIPHHLQRHDTQSEHAPL